MNNSRRFKSKHNAAVYHCISRTINGEKLFDDHAKEILRKQLHQAAEFSGVEIITYALMSNHFHVLVRIPEQGTVSDEELLRRYKALYPQPTKWATARIEVLESVLKQGGKDAQELREKLLCRMNDVSEFMKTFKLRFAVWFNRSHKRFGHLWSERFTSTIIEGNRHFALQMVAAYIDLNPIRAGMVKDPKDYRWCGYGEAATSTEDTAKTMLRGLRSALLEGGLLDDAGVLATYRVGLFAKGAAPKRGDAKAATIRKEDFKKEVEIAERLAGQRHLWKRESRFSRGGVVGSLQFVTEHLTKYQQTTKSRTHIPPAPFSEGNTTDWNSLFSMRNHQ
jgi:REP element-mobilizing transposase RayT